MVRSSYYKLQLFYQSVLPNHLPRRRNEEAFKIMTRLGYNIPTSFECHDCDGTMVVEVSAVDCTRVWHLQFLCVSLCTGGRPAVLY